ncbi:hypothetical protein [Caulobacter sp. FWC2]|jgi:hypothetical protein|uniref:hypothetical protein n=1 Tax=Caulobacter sp. FWC2 TaxID=69664 RepID=UPI000C156E92|nr:hypothetical protein [Caulobacter sp. FWC2]PIB92491.1 hypothetical protein CSW62_13490 [Caulobacter sp. FWC2]
MTKTPLLLAFTATLLLGACSDRAPPPTPESSSDKAAASAPAGVGATREKLPDPVNDGRPTAKSAKTEAARQPGT